MSCREMIKMRHNRRWRALANRIDEWCRVWVPIFYITCLFLLFNVSLDDGYGRDEDGVVKSRVVFQGLPPVIEIEDGMAGAVLHPRTARDRADPGADVLLRAPAPA